MLKQKYYHDLFSFYPEKFKNHTPDMQVQKSSLSTTSVIITPYVDIFKYYYFRADSEELMQ